MQDERRMSLEQALAKTESEAADVLKASSAVTAALKRVRVLAQAGNLRDLPTAIAAAEQAIAVLRQEFANAKESWDFDENSYFADNAFSRELLETAARMNVRIFERDDRLYCYPALIRVLPNERVVLIDKTREPRIRPTLLVNQLKDLQRRKPRFKPEPFLQTLHSAYTTIVAKRGRELFGAARVVVRLVEIYDLLTLLPGQSREYSRQEFARDIYLLDQSGVTKTRTGHAVSFPASTGTRAAHSTITVITQGGQEKVYYGISFSPSG